MNTKESTCTRILGVRFRPCGKVFFFKTEDPDIKVGDRVVVESMFGLTIGTVIKEVADESVQGEIKSIIRKASEEDLRAEADNRNLEEEAFRFCLERIKARGLPMKLVSTEVMLDRRRIVFYFTADGRIDFRELVKDLAAKYKTRIEMRQIGVRDEAKVLGGLGVCGRPLCCCSFLDSFVPISVRMAKEQQIVLNTAKLTGVCGRLMCCLSYEYEGTIEGEDEIVVESEEGVFCEECPSDTVSSLLDQVVEETEEGSDTEVLTSSDTTDVRETSTQVERELPEGSQPHEPLGPQQEPQRDNRQHGPKTGGDTHDEHRNRKARSEKRRRRRKRKKHKRRRH